MALADERRGGRLDQVMRLVRMPADFVERSAYISPRFIPGARLGVQCRFGSCNPRTILIR